MNEYIRNGSSNGKNSDGSASGHLDALKVLALLLKHKFFILISIAVATVTAIIYALTLPNWYASTVSIVPPKRSMSGAEGILGNVSSALKDIGMTKIGGKGSDSYGYIVFFNGRRLRDSIIDKFNLAKVYQIPATKRKKLHAALESNLEINYEPEGNYTITAWHTNPNEAARIANTIVEIANNMAREVEQAESKATREYLEERLRQTDSIINSASQELQLFSKQKFIIAPEEQAIAAAGGLAEMRAEIIKGEIKYQTLKNNYGENDPATQEQKKVLVQLNEQLRKAESQPGFGGNFALDDATGVAIRYKKLSVELETFGKLKAFLMPMIEQNRLDETRYAQTMYVIDPAVPADQKDRPKRSLVVLGAALAAFIASVLFIIVRYRYKSFKKQYKQLVSEEHSNLEKVEA